MDERNITIFNEALIKIGITLQGSDYKTLMYLSTKIDPINNCIFVEVEDDDLILKSLKVRPLTFRDSVRNLKLLNILVRVTGKMYLVNPTYVCSNIDNIETYKKLLNKYDNA